MNTPPSNPDDLSIVFLPPNHWKAPPDSQAARNDPEGNSALHHLARLGVRWRVINPTGRPWNPFANPFLRGIDPLRTLRVLLTCRKADAVVSVFESNALLLLLLRGLLLFHPRVILWDASVGNPWRVLRFIQKIVFPRYDGFMMLTSSQESHLREHFQIKAPLAKISYNIDESFYRPCPDVPTEYVLAVGDDISRDYPTLLAAAARCPSRFVVKSKWRPAGAVPGPSNVTFLSDRLDAEAFRTLYARARIVVLPLHPVEHAGGITALFEAMAMGKPLVVTASGVARDFVTDGVHALIVPPGDPAALAAAVNRLEGDEGLRCSLGEQARRHIEGRLSTAALAGRMRDFVAEVCRVAGGSAR